MNKNNANEKLSPARLSFLESCAGPRGCNAVDYYAPLKWALLHGYVALTRPGCSTYVITDAGRAALEAAKKKQ
jgi:hypothetical protein